MIYGRNFNSEPIPANLIRMFRLRRRIMNHGLDGPPIMIFTLVGVCSSFAELRLMRDQADNGHRVFRYVANFSAQGEQWYAIYVH